MRIDRLDASGIDRVLALSNLFDHPPRREWTELFLGREGHHLLLARVDDIDVGFVTGIELAHPDKGVEMLLYEMGVMEPYRRQGIGKALTLAIVDVARDRGCRAVWVPTEEANQAAVATYLSAGAAKPGNGVILEWRFS